MSATVPTWLKTSPARYKNTTAKGVEPMPQPTVTITVSDADALLIKIALKQTFFRLDVHPAMYLAGHRIFATVEHARIVGNIRYFAVRSLPLWWRNLRAWLLHKRQERLCAWLGFLLAGGVLAWLLN
jgi:hypothetical protein